MDGNQQGKVLGFLTAICQSSRSIDVRQLSDTPQSGMTVRNSDQNLALYLDQSAISRLNDLILYLKGLSNNLLGEQQVSSLVTGGLHNIVLAGTDICTAGSAQLGRVVADLEKGIAEASKTWLVAVPLVGVQLPREFIRLLGVMIVAPDDHSLAAAMESYGFPSSSIRGRLAAFREQNRCAPRIDAFCLVRGRGASGAIVENSEEQARSAVYSINAVLAAIGYLPPCRLGLSDDDIALMMPLFAQAQSGGGTWSEQSRGRVAGNQEFRLPLNQVEVIKKIKDYKLYGALDRCFEKFYSGEADELIENLCVMWSWIGRAVSSRSFSQSATDSVVAIEAGLGLSARHPIVACVSAFGAALEAKDSSDFLILRKQLTSLYGERSAFVHAGRSTAGKTLSTAAREHSYRIVEGLLSVLDKVENVPALHNHLRERVSAFGGDASKLVEKPAE